MKPRVVAGFLLLASPIFAWPQAQANKSPVSAEAKLRADAEKGNADAQFALGLMYTSGKGVPQNGARAAEWFRKAMGQGKPRALRVRADAEKGSAEAQYSLGVMYFMVGDYPQAATWFRKAVAQGHSGAQYFLGLMYEYGWGVPKDPAQSIEWWRKAADQGHVSAQWGLGNSYRSGQVVKQDYAQAVAWFRKAAEQGEATPMSDVAESYLKGQGVPRDNVQALMWANLAAARASAADKAQYTILRDGIAAKMTPPQIAQSQKLAREWMEAFERLKK